MKVKVVTNKLNKEIHKVYCEELSINSIKLDLIDEFNNGDIDVINATHGPLTGDGLKYLIKIETLADTPREFIVTTTDVK